MIQHFGLRNHTTRNIVQRMRARKAIFFVTHLRLFCAFVHVNHAVDFAQHFYALFLLKTSKLRAIVILESAKSHQEAVKLRNFACADRIKAAMSCKRRGNVILDYVEESSSEEENDDTRDFDYEMPSRSRSASRRQESMVSNSSSEPRRRGRAVSKRPCLNRNAQMARENRQRKKEYLEKLENKLSFYKQGNKNLANVVQRQRIDLKRLKAEVSYLKNVMNNSSSITKLLKSMNDTLSRKNNDKDNCCIEKNLWNQNDSGNSNSSEKHDEISPKVWKDNGRTPWQQGGKFIDSSATRNSPYEISAGNLKNLSLGDSDHTYTTSRESSIDEKLRNYDEIHAPCSVDSGVFSQIAGDRFISDLIPNSLNFEVPEEISELPQFDEDLFDSIGNEATNDSMEYFRNDSCNDTASNLFEGLENSGICLHVNSGKVSLEFCSICHLNSINSME